VRRRGAVFGALLLSTCSAATASAQSPLPRRLTLEQAIAFALEHHPDVRAVRADQDAAAAETDRARVADLPQGGLSAQLNRSTGNTAPGGFFSTMGFVPIAGPVRSRSLDGGTWQTGASLWADWEMTSLARQAATVDAALAAESEARAATGERTLELAYDVADAFLAVLAAEEAVKATRASIERGVAFAVAVKALVNQSLRPGVDAARADSELAVAQTQLFRAQQTEAVQATRLAVALGVAGESVEALPGALLGPADTARAAPPPERTLDHHPLVRQRIAEVAHSEQDRKLVDLAYLPRVDLVGALWLRGSGYYPGNSDIDGLVPNIANWAVGVTATWNVFEIPAIRARARAAEARRAHASARRDAAELAVAGELTSAYALLEGAQRIASNTPPALASARAAEAQAVARYQAALSPVVDVADAQRLLAQAELEDALARLDVRRATLLVARAAGDLGPFVASSRATAGGP
jgi:outer membrane protein